MKKLTKELQNKTMAQLEEEAASLRSQMARLRLENKMKPSKDTNRVFKIGKRLAVVLTIWRQKKLLETYTNKSTHE